MFFTSITKDGVAQNFQSVKVEEFNLHSWKISIVTDKFLSDFITEPDGFSIIESPLINTPDFQKIIFSKVSFENKNDSVTIFKSTISGRPIYYHINSAGEFFCSTHISLLRSAGVPIEENRDVLPEFFIYRCVVPPQTLFKNIHQVIAGSTIRFKQVNGKYRISPIEKYNPPLPIKSHKKEDSEPFVTNTRTILEKTIGLLNPCSKNLEVLLSGGLDSSILFKICQDTYGIKTAYSAGYPFEDPKKNKEKEYALSAGDAFHIENIYYHFSTEQYLRGFIEGISGAEEPLHHLQSVLFYLLFKDGIPKTKNIIISGLGADGIFGTSTHYIVLNQEKLPQILRYFSYNLLKIICKIIDREKFPNNLFSRSFTKLNNNSLLWSIGSYGYDKWVQQYFTASEQDIIHGRENLVKMYTDRSMYDLISILDFYRTSVTQSIWSKVGESNGKIIFYPYNDLELINCAFSIPWEIKLKAPKYILRSVAQQLEIPEFIITRPKSSFGVLAKIWMEKGGTFEPLIPLASKVFDEKEIRKMQSSEPKKGMTYWNMLNYSIWKRICINNEPVDVLLEELA